jgi:Phosphorylase superfamily
MNWTTDAPYRETRQQLDQYGEEGVLAVEMQAASLFAQAQVRQAQIAVVAHVSNATDHEGEPFNRGSEDEGVQILTAICFIFPRPIHDCREVFMKGSGHFRNFCIQLTAEWLEFRVSWGKRRRTITLLTTTGLEPLATM